jgi:hypothetical protein
MTVLFQNLEAKASPVTEFGSSDKDRSGREAIIYIKNSEYVQMDPYLFLIINPSRKRRNRNTANSFPYRSDLVQVLGVVNIGFYFLSSFCRVRGVALEG